MATSTSPARLAANRRNALRSTGPRTVEGKARSSLNAAKHGLRARRALLLDESLVEYQTLAAALVEQLAPESAMEEIVVDDIVGLVWRLRRASRIEVALFSIGGAGPVLEALRRSGEVDAAVGVAFAAQVASFATLSRYEVALANRLRRALADLERLQAQRDTANTKLVVIAGEG